MTIRARFTMWLCDQIKVGEWEGIVLSDCNSNKSDDPVFVATTQKALNLIRTIAPQQSARIARNVRYILNIELDSWAKYGPGLVCQIDFGAYPFSTHPDWSFFQYAGSIIHEATHGALFAKGIPYTRENKLRVESICCEEKNRFLRRAEKIHNVSLAQPFDPHQWKECSRLERWRKLIRRIREERKKAQQAGGAYVSPEAGDPSAHP